MGDVNVRFLEKNGIDYLKIMYMTKDGRKTFLYIEDGRVVETFHSLKGFVEELPEGKFRYIQKGVVVASKYIIARQGNRLTMKDGNVFIVREAYAHQEILSQNQNPENEKNTKTFVEEKENWKDWKEFEVFNQLPLAFCVIEMVFDEHGHGVDFIFRYCNEEMENLEGKSLEDMMNHSFYEVFKNGDRKWLDAYADVALNGTRREIHSYSPEVNANLRIYCYQPKPNYCACVLIRL